jgi:hypothetical protein
MKMGQVRWLLCPIFINQILSLNNLKKAKGNPHEKSKTVFRIGIGMGVHLGMCTHDGL